MDKRKGCFTQKWFSAIIEAAREERGCSQALQNVRVLVVWEMWSEMGSSVDFSIMNLIFFYDVF